MKVLIKAVKHSPSGIETIDLENVSRFEVDDNEVKVSFNGEEDQRFTLVNTETDKNGCWFGLSIFCEKVGLKVKP